MKRFGLLPAILCLTLAGCASTAPMDKPVVEPVSSNKLEPAGSAPMIQEPRIRVGLLTDQSSVRFDRRDGGYILSADGKTWALKRGFTVTAPLAGSAVRYAVQIAAISDPDSANALTTKVESETGLKAIQIFDARGLYRILVGDFAESSQAEPLRGQLMQRGYEKTMTIVPRPSTATFERVHSITDDEGITSTLRGDAVMIQPASGETIAIDKQLYRGAAVLFLNSRGMFNVVNELNLEDYTRGVVPAEMGPRVYDEVEAIKAQALAARTYAVKRLREYRAEGYDICATPACQVYKGFSAEDDMSNQAVKETAGMIITYGGEPIDALFTSTCGGDTSDVGTMFPGRSEPYLKAAHCVELDLLSIAGREDSGLLTEMQFDARLFSQIAGDAVSKNTIQWTSREAMAAIASATRIAGMTSAPATLPSARRADVLRYLAAVWKLGDAANTLILPEDRRYFFPQPRQGNEDAYAIAAFLVKFRVLPGQYVDKIDLNAAMPREELHALLLGWLRKMDIVQETTGKIASLSGREIALKAEGKITRYSLPAGSAIYRRLNDRLQEYRTAPVLIGDRLNLIRIRDRIIGGVIQANYDGAAFDRTSSFSSWVRSFRADELVTSINKRNPITTLEGIRPLVIDPSRRIAEMEVTAEGGRTFILKGLPVRWSLNVPDNLFVYQKSVDPDGMDRYTFFGKGWGHGIGMCQVGAYGMAFRGWKADRIIKHYYKGVEIVPMKQVTRGTM